MMYVDNDDAARIMHEVGGGFSPEAYSGAEDYWFYVAEELGVSEEEAHEWARRRDETWRAKQGPQWAQEAANHET